MNSERLFQDGEYLNEWYEVIEYSDCRGAAQYYLVTDHHDGIVRMACVFDSCFSADPDEIPRQDGDVRDAFYCDNEGSTHLVFIDDNIDWFFSMLPSPNNQSIQGQVECGVVFNTYSHDKGGFKDVAGMQELKDQLRREIMFTISNPDLARRYRLKPLNGMVLYGPPGCGKSFLAEKFAQESGLKFALIKGSDLGNIYLHGSQSMIASLFKKAEQNAPCVVCLDEIDSLIPNRKGMSADQTMVRQEVNEFLSQLNNCGSRGIFVIASTNSPETLDPAALRAGRLEKQIYVPMPDIASRQELLKYYLKDRPVEEVNLEELARLTEGYVASDLELIVNQAALDAAIAGTLITEEMLVDRIQKTSRSVSEKDARYYEELNRRIKGEVQNNQARASIGFTIPRYQHEDVSTPLVAQA